MTALTLDADGRVTGAVADVVEPASYRGRWYGVGTGDGQNQGGTGRQLRDARGHPVWTRNGTSTARGWCDYLKGKTHTEIAGIPSRRSWFDADLAALCTISVTELHHLEGCAGGVCGRVKRRKEERRKLFLFSLQSDQRIGAETPCKKRRTALTFAFPLANGCKRAIL